MPAMIRSTLTAVATAVNYGVAMAATALVVHVASGGLLPAQATLGIVLFAGGLYALCSAAVVARFDAEPAAVGQTTVTYLPIAPAPAWVPAAAARPQPAMAFAAEPSSISA